MDKNRQTMNKYLGITIGPIYATLSQAQKTREFWLGSYFFSHVMKLILREIQQQEYGTILAQDISTLDKDEKFHGAGIYSDRCYVRLEKEFQQKEYNALVEAILSNLSKLKVKDKDALKEYLQVYCTVQEIPEDENYMSVLNQQLDVMELQTQYYTKHTYALVSGHDNLKKLRKDGEKIILSTDIEEGLISDWYELGFNRKDDLIEYKCIKSKIYSFPSLLEITTKGLDRLNHSLYEKKIHPLFKKAFLEEIKGQPETIQKSSPCVQKLLLEEIEGKPKTMTDRIILKKIKNVFSKNFQTAHKYIAIVTADGDNVGKLTTHIAERKEDELLKTVSKNIMDFSKEASELIYQYGGKPVYIGGDDLVFFAPIVSNSGENQDLWFKGDADVFLLIQILDKTFNNIWNQWLSENKVTDIHPSLSYGISITYYKFPLYEAMNLSHDLLIDYAKEAPGKNSIAIQLMTHSGSYDKTVLGKHTFGHLLKLLENFTDKESVINSVLQRLREDTNLLLSIAKDEDSFNAYFINEYDFHKIKNVEKKQFIEHSISLFNEIFEQQKEHPEEALNQLCSMYRLLNFLIHKETGNGNGNDI
ncbi:MAG: hypothetical protein LBS55_06405 [Prevotellaceae bacterium]|jgi:CRISPR-associated protein Cmr2|nr:hypothetical protein [Prevotellaceae bacterium]